MCSLVFDCVCVCVCACTNGFGKVKGHLMFVESTFCVFTLADGWCCVLAYVCGQWAQMEDNCVSATNTQGQWKTVWNNNNNNNKSFSAFSAAQVSMISDSFVRKSALFQAGSQY